MGSSLKACTACWYREAPEPGEAIDYLVYRPEGTCRAQERSSRAFRQVRQRRAHSFPARWHTGGGTHVRSHSLHFGTSALLPNVVIIGAMKCGTTSLHQYLDQHPLVSMSRPKELNFFTWNWDKGLAWYEAHFDAKAAVRGESSPSYTDPKGRGAPQRMYSVLPNAKLIYILRDPIERAISHYLHAYCRRGEDRPISEALRPCANNRYVDSSRYFLQLEQYLEFYSPSQILVLTMDELRKCPQGVLDKVCEFLDIPFSRPNRSLTANVSEKRGRNNWLGRLTESDTGKRIGRLLPMSATDFVKDLNLRMAERVGRPTLDEDLRLALADYLREDVASLRKYTGERFETWSI